jgi:ribonucleotide reductase beta subunit family protein with ferritin-like domain
MTRITTPTNSYTRHYPNIVNLALKQFEKQFWTASEMKVHLDKMQLMYELTPEQLHAVKTVLGLFVHYELKVGDFWQQVAKVFPRPEVKLAASLIDSIERAVHAEFYNEVNIQLGLDTDEHYLAYTQDPILNARAEWLDNVLRGEDKILGVIIFSMTETALLFSSFSILKSFQSNGYNLIPVIVRGTNQSAVDEDHHGQVSAEIINTYYSELGSSLREDTERYAKVLEAVDAAYEHECRIIDLAIIGDSLNGITKDQYKQHVKGRLNIYLNRLSLPARFKVTDRTVEDWYEKNTYAYKVIDFFTAGMGMEYETSYNKRGFSAAWRESE